MSYRDKVSAQERPQTGSLTWPIGSGFLRVQFGPQGSPWLQLGLGKLGQVGHDRVLVHIWIYDLLWGDHLSQTEDRGHLISNLRLLGHDPSLPLGLWPPGWPWAARQGCT